MTDKTEGKILIVDDETIVQESIKIHLKRDKYEIQTANNGVEGYDKIVEFQPDVVILDLRMPRMSGLELLEKLEHKPEDDYAVIILTGHGSDTDMRTCFNMGISAYLRKPFNANELRGLIRNTLELKLAQRELKNYKDHLENLVQERTVELAERNDALRRENKMRREAQVQLQRLASFPRFDIHPIIETDFSPAMTYSNPAAEKYFKDLHVLREKHGIFIILESFLTKLVQHKKPDETIIQFQDKHFEVRAYSLMTQDLLRLHFYDITDRIRSENEKKQLEASLNQSQKLNAIGQLAGGIAHDFNNILAAMIGYLEITLDELPKDHAVRDNLQEVLDGATRAKDLVLQILLFGRKVDNKVETINISKTLQEVVKMLRPTIPTTIEINLAIDNKNTFARANSSKIFQVFMNLCTNAVFAMKDESGKLSMHVHDSKTPQNVLDEIQARNDEAINSAKFVCVSVEDSGVGIPPDIIDRIFEPFFTTKSQNEGNGLGLSMTHGIVTELGGAIRVSSEVGKGTRFEIYIPLTDLMPVTEKELKVAHRPRRQGSESILVVDDERTLAKMLSVNLRRHGYKPTICTDSLKALDIFKQGEEKFDLVISDVTMPNMPGDILAMRLREIDPNIPIIISTGFTNRMSVEKAEEMGINGYLQKPVMTETLIDTVQGVLDEVSGK